MNKPKNERNEKRLTQKRVKRVSRFRALAAENNIKALSSQSDDDAALYYSRADFWNQCADKVESPKYILANSAGALDALKLKADRLAALNRYFKKCNVAFKSLGNIGNIRVTDHWRSIIYDNIRAHSVPFTKDYFNRVRQVLFFTRKRIKALESSRYFRPFTVNDIPVSLLDGQIVVEIPFTPSVNDVSKLKNAPLRMHWSKHRKAWVKKFTGQGSDYFDALKEVLTILKPKKE